MNFSHIYCAYFVVEAAAPLKIGAGESGSTSTQLIVRDAMGLPYIPGSSLAGILRHELSRLLGPDAETAFVGPLFGYQLDKEQIRKKAKQEQIREEDVQNGQGSRLVVNSAHLLQSDGVKVVDGLQDLQLDWDYLQNFQYLPNRDHVRINHRGTADTEQYGKFEEEVVFRGTRFAFSLELSGTLKDQTLWQQLLNILHAPIFRIGGGTRKGFGRLIPITCLTRIFELQNEADMVAYLQMPNHLNASLETWDTYQGRNELPAGWLRYKVQVRPENFFLFGAGFGDGQVDQMPKTEAFIKWEDGKGQFGQEVNSLVIPASSIKGALSHRVAFHYNKASKQFIFSEKPQQTPPTFSASETVEAFGESLMPDLYPTNSYAPEWQQLIEHIDKIDVEELCSSAPEWNLYIRQLEQFELEQTDSILPVGEHNPAVSALFGFARTGLDQTGKISGAKGRVIIDDLFISIQKTDEKVFSHVSIDRFTGGTRHGALFQERVTSGPQLSFDIYVHTTAFEGEHVQQAFESALEDLTSGALPIGGNTTKGHGVFTGSYHAIK